MNKTNIGWCDWTWNPLDGCDWASPGCDNCYAYLRDMQVVSGQLIPNALLQKDVTLAGTPDMDWYHKIRKMDRAILLLFSRSPETQSTLNTMVTGLEEALK